MASGNDREGCGCVLLIIGALVLAGGGSISEAFGAMAAGWLGYLVFIGVSVGIVVLIIKVIAGK